MSIITRYAEDLTGTNPDNKIDGELYSLTDRPVRGVIPKYGPFFADTLVVFDKATSRRLDKGVDYVIPFISQEMTLRTGKTIADSFLIINSQVSSQILMSYQNVGGDIQNNIDNLVNIYESYLKDNRSVDWISGVFGKPMQYPPSEHAHWLADIYGFEPIVYQLERIAQAINLSNSPALEALYDAIMSNVATSQDIKVANPSSNKFIVLGKLLEAAQTYNFNTIRLAFGNYLLNDGETVDVGVEATNLPDGTTLYWTILHGETKDSDFVGLSGSFEVNSYQSAFTVQLARNLYVEQAESFRIQIRLNSPTGTVIAVSRKLIIQPHSVSLVNILQSAYVSPTFASPRMPKDVRSMLAFRWSRYE